MKDQHRPEITILGLGPGDPAMLTRQAWEVLAQPGEIYLRTGRHPAVPHLPPSRTVYTFDELYEAADDFSQVYEQIVTRILALGKRPEGVLYAVPGHPLVGERTTLAILRQGQAAGLSVRVVEGISFMEPVYTALELDPFPRLTLVDALDLGTWHHPLFPPDAPALVAQIYSPAVASEVKLTLGEAFPDLHPVKLVHGAGTPGQRVEDLALFEIDRSPHINWMTCLYLPPLGEATSFEAFQELIAHLRSPDGCPWDREQTHLSLRPYLLEETYEALAALDAEDPAALMEELGDLLIQVVLHAQIATEDGAFNMAEVLGHVHRKLVRRHPHVFDGVRVENSEDVKTNWEQLKVDERRARGQQAPSALDGIPQVLPALSQADAYQKRAARVGFDWPAVDGVLDKVEEELRELRTAPDEPGRAAELGDLLFSLVNLARWYKMDAETALREANQRFRQRFQRMEARLREQGLSMRDLPLDELDKLWEAAKADESE